MISRSILEGLSSHVPCCAANHAASTAARGAQHEARTEARTDDINLGYSVMNPNWLVGYELIPISWSLSFMWLRSILHGRIEKEGKEKPKSTLGLSAAPWLAASMLGGLKPSGLDKEQAPRITVVRACHLVHRDL